MLYKVHLGKSQPNPTKVILVRHGRSTYNEQGRYQGSCDASVLTEKGRKSAYQTGLALDRFPIDAIYTSPLKRTQQTAREILRAISTGSSSSPALFTHSKLRELSMHQWEGLAFSEVKQRFPQAYRCWKQTPDRFQMVAPTAKTTFNRGNLAVITAANPVCFPVVDLYQQAREFWQEILPRHQGQTISIVGHGGTNRALIATAVGLASSHFHALQQCNCGISVLEFEPLSSPSARLESLNLSTHLGKPLPKLKEGRQGLRLLLLPTENEPLSETKPLARLLQDVEIDFSLSDDRDSRGTTARILGDRATVQLEVSRDDFSRAWHQAIASPSRDRANLTTGLVVARVGVLKRLISQFLGNENLSLYPGAISVIHYLEANRKPVLQALNIQP